jgi:hypothetical protein
VLHNGSKLCRGKAGQDAGQCWVYNLCYRGRPEDGGTGWAPPCRLGPKAVRCAGRSGGRAVHCAPTHPPNRLPTLARDAPQSLGLPAWQPRQEALVSKPDDAGELPFGCNPPARLAA